MVEFADENARQADHLFGGVRLPGIGLHHRGDRARLFSFNNPHGACPECDGLGTELFFEPELVVPDESPEPRARRGRALGAHSATSPYYQQTLEALARALPLSR